MRLSSHIFKPQTPLQIENRARGEVSRAWKSAASAQNGEGHSAHWRFLLPNFGVFKLESNPEGKPDYRIKRKMALDLVDRGLAREINSHTIQMLTKPERSYGLKSRQGRAYEAAAIETIIRPHLVGGLTRTETQPAPFEQFKAARVGHQ